MKTKVDLCFDEDTIKKGYYYYCNNKVKNITKDHNSYDAVVIGSFGNYNVNVEFSNNRKEELDDFECDCCVFEENGECKHIYALVCSIFKLDKDDSLENPYDLSKYISSNYDRVVKLYKNDKITIDDIEELGFDVSKVLEDIEDEEDYEEKPTFRISLFSILKSIIRGLIGHSNSTLIDYDDNYEELDLEEDDFHFDDLD